MSSHPHKKVVIFKTSPQLLIYNKLSSYPPKKSCHLQNTTTTSYHPIHQTTDYSQYQQVLHQFCQIGKFFFCLSSIRLIACSMVGTTTLEEFSTGLNLEATTAKMICDPQVLRFPHAHLTLVRSFWPTESLSGQPKLLLYLAVYYPLGPSTISRLFSQLCEPLFVMQSRLQVMMHLTCE